MHRVTIAERIHPNDTGEAIVSGFNIKIESPVAVTDAEIVQSFGPSRNHMPRSPHTFNDIGRVSIGGADTAFLVVSDENDCQGLF